MNGFSFTLCLSTLLLVFVVSKSSDTITLTRSLKDGETIFSSERTFEMGFFTPSNSKNRYVGIWYKKVSVFTVVWVANREVPLKDTLGVLEVRKSGVLVLLNGNSSIIWSTNSSRSVQNPVAKLLESGNLVVKNKDDEDSPKNFLWQSFDYPGNTLLPGMKLGKDYVTGRERHVSSWKSDDDPSQGNYTYYINTNGYPQLAMGNGHTVTFLSGPWNGIQFSGSVNLKPNSFFTYRFVVNKEEVFFDYALVNKSVPFQRVLRPNGIMQRYTWAEPKGDWVLYSSTPTDNCDTFATCGAYSSCKLDNSPMCGCLEKFVPRYQKDWDVGDWSNGCIRKTPLDCEKGDGFLKYSEIKLPDTRKAWYNINMTLEECGKMCLANCSCVAYSNMDIRGKGSGCFLWFDDLMNIKYLGPNAQNLYVRMASSDLETDSSRVIFIVSLALPIGTVLLIISLAFYAWKKHKQLRETGIVRRIFRLKITKESHNEDLTLPLFDFATIMKATDNLSMKNKLGEGGYGPVYKGVLEGGQEIAVKRLSKSSSQGLDEFKNEVIFIAKLQHRNLVKLLGCCIQREEKMLIYEYMSNNSLDSFIFDEIKCTLLDWPMRFNIINGISRGLLYLHQDSRLRIIHRDLKTSNILLDTDMNPKISDFGMARSFGGNELEANTCRVVGTYGYMSPEYAIHGIFSVKSDVFSFGVLVLEIISGKKNRGFSHPNHSLNLVGHAWTLYREERSMELVDDSIRSSCNNTSEVLRYIHVALLCVQQNREDRPSMATVVLMLTSDSTLPEPKEPGFSQPGFFTGNEFLESESTPPSSLNGLTNTWLDPR